MKSSPLKPGKPLQRRAPLKAASKPSTRPSFTAASAKQREKVRWQVCAVCGIDGCDPAHLCPRSFRGCDNEDCVIALCREHHRALDDGRIDLLPFLSGQGFERELAHMQGHYGDPLSVLYRLSGVRWVPERQADRV